MLEPLGGKKTDDLASLRKKKALIRSISGGFQASPRNAPQIRQVRPDEQRLNGELRSQLLANKLITIDISRQSIGDVGVICLAKMLASNSSVKEMYLRNNKIGHKGARALAMCLMANTYLQTLDLWDNEIGNRGAEELGSMLLTNGTLTSLNLDSNRIGTLGALALSQGLQRNTSLCVLNLEGNKIEDRAAEALAGALAQNRTSALTVLNLCQNRITLVGYKAFLATMRVNTSLKSLYLEADPRGASPHIASIIASIDAACERNTAGPKPQLAPSPPTTPPVLSPSTSIVLETVLESPLTWDIVAPILVLLKNTDCSEESLETCMRLSDCITRFCGRSRTLQTRSNQRKLMELASRLNGQVFQHLPVDDG